MEDQINSYKLQKIIHVKNMRKYYDNLRKKNLDYKKIIKLLDKKIIDKSLKVATNLDNYVKNKKIIKINIKNLFSDEEWKLLPLKIKILYSKTFEQIYDIKNWDWLPLLGIIYQLGLVLLLPEFSSLPKWTVTADIFPLGCCIHKLNKYYKKKRTNMTKYGIYKPFCGFSNMWFSYGYGEFISSQLLKKKIKLPQEAFYILKFHKFHSWIDEFDESRGYTYLADMYDWKMLPLLKLFNKCCLEDNFDSKDNFNKIINKYLKKKIF